MTHNKVMDFRLRNMTTTNQATRKRNTQFLKETIPQDQIENLFE
jgi:hypothetical protein